MFIYEKKLQFPIRVRNTNPALAKFILSQYGGPDGELGASLRYLSQRYSMPTPELKGLLTDIGTEAPFMFQPGMSFSDEAARKTQKKEIPCKWMSIRPSGWMTARSRSCR